MKRKVAYAGMTVLAVAVLAAVGVYVSDTPGTVQAAQKTSPAPAVQVPAVVASMDDVAVGTDELEQLIRGLSPEVRRQLMADRSSAEALVRRRLAEKKLAAKAEQEGWAKRPDVLAQLEAARSRILSENYLSSVSQVPADFPSADMLKAAYEQAKPNLQQPASYRISQIFLAIPADDAKAVEKVRGQAAELVRQARARDADFAALARQHSQDPNSAAAGGDTGWVPLQQLVPAVRAAAAKLKKGEVSEPIQGDSGVHILKLVDLREPRTPEYQEVEAYLRSVLRRQQQAANAQKYMDELIRGGRVSIDGPALQAALTDTAASSGR